MAEHPSREVPTAAWDPGFGRRSPWLAPALHVFGALEHEKTWPAVERYTELVERRRRAFAPDVRPVRFVVQTPKPRRRAPGPVDRDALYDVRISVHDEVPSRPENPHDFWNAVAWALFPRSKRAIHARQYRALVAWLPEGATEIPGKRTREQDALTILDEGGVLVAATSAAARAIAEGGFETEVTAAIARGEARLEILGHAVLEHLQRGAPPVQALAHVIAVGGTLPDDPDAFFDAIDRALARDVTDEALFREPSAHGSILVSADGTASPGPGPSHR